MIRRIYLWRPLSIYHPRLLRTDGRLCVRWLLDNRCSLFSKAYKMHSPTFLNLCNSLKSRGLLKKTKFVCIEEQVVIFPGTVGQNKHYYVTQWYFCCSVWTLLFKHGFKCHLLIRSWLFIISIFKYSQKN